MAYTSQHGTYWRAEVRKRGYKPIYRTFDAKQQARDWAQRVEAEISLNIFIDRSEAERSTLGDALASTPVRSFRPNATRSKS